MTPVICVLTVAEIAYEKMAEDDEQDALDALEREASDFTKVS